MKIAEEQHARGVSHPARARSVLIALLTSPHFIYKAESPEVERVTDFRISLNSTPTLRF